MTLTVGTASGNKVAAGITVGAADGNKAVQVGYVGTAEGNKVFFSAMTAEIDPIGRTWSGDPESGYTCAEFTASAVGGVGPYTYLWECSTGDAAADDPTAASTGFSSSTGAASDVHCTITDSVGATASTPIFFGGII